MNNPVYVIGDSHSRTFARNANFLPLFIGPGKEINFISDKNTNRTVNRIVNIVEKHKIKKIMTYLGEPDTRFYLGKGWMPWKSNQPCFMSGYANKVKESANRYSTLVQELLAIEDVSVAVLNVTPSERKEQNQIVDAFNNSLLQKCNKLGALFVDINSNLYVDQYLIDPSYCGDPVHLNNKIQPIVEDFLINHGWLEKSKFLSESNWENSKVKQEFEFNPKFGCFTPR